MSRLFFRCWRRVRVLPVVRARCSCRKAASPCCSDAETPRSRELTGKGKAAHPCCCWTVASGSAQTQTTSSRRAQQWLTHACSCAPVQLPPKTSVVLPRTFTTTKHSNNTTGKKVPWTVRRAEVTQFISSEQVRRYTLFPLLSHSVLHLMHPKTKCLPVRMSWSVRVKSRQSLRFHAYTQRGSLGGRILPADATVDAMSLNQLVSGRVCPEVISRFHLGVLQRTRSDCHKEIAQWDGPNAVSSARS